MPIYGYECECGKTKDVMKRMCEYNTEELCECGKAMSKTINAPTITGMNSLGQSGGIIDKGGKIQ
jgi:putative FmdB family regulatory protein